MLIMESWRSYISEVELEESRATDAAKIAPLIAKCGGIKILQQMDPTNNNRAQPSLYRNKYLVWLARHLEDSLQYSARVADALNAGDEAELCDAVLSVLNNYEELASLLADFDVLSRKGQMPERYVSGNPNDINQYDISSFAYCVREAKKDIQEKKKKKALRKEYDVIYEKGTLLVAARPTSALRR